MGRGSSRGRRGVNERAGATELWGVGAHQFRPVGERQGNFRASLSGTEKLKLKAHQLCAVGEEKC